MFIYNVTIKVRTDIHEAWLQWLHEEHIPDMMSSECFTSSNVYRLLEVDDSEGPTYVIQYKAESKGQYNHYIDKFASEMRSRSYEKWGDAFIAFRTLMQVVN